ncbi:unnamed protein product [Brassicogethes aeneus]|uniref:Uncharacterized protein n=1 Tax=Brassicogethes aeneus TaxID=1431903 RepID=A0A9P0FD99_BRAAE|nr:unnamed protein product [Brassicogethes aeneus]
MKIFLIISSVMVATLADQCHYGQTSSKPQSLVTCKSIPVDALGKNMKLMGKTGPFDSVHDLELTNFTGKLDANSLSMFPNLQRLVIQDSNFAKLDATVFSKCCKNLKKLSIRNNPQTVIEPASFKDLNHLEELHINNKINKLSKAFLQGMPAIKKLTLRRTKISEIDENAFEDVKNLDSLEIYDNDFPSVKPKTFAPLKELKKISILDNALLKTFPLDLLKEQKKLELLGLPAEILSKLDASALKKQMPTLKKIEVKVDDKKKYETFFKKVTDQGIIVNYIGAYF